MENNRENPFYIHKGKNHLRYLSIILLIGFSILGIYSIQFAGYVMLLVPIAAIFGLLSIQFPFISLYNHCFVIEKKALFKKLSSSEVFRYRDLKGIDLIKGYVNWPHMIIQTMFGEGGYGGFSKPDQMRLTLKNEKNVIIYRFGGRKEFENLISNIQKKIMPST